VVFQQDSFPCPKVEDNPGVAVEESLGLHQCQELALGDCRPQINYLALKVDVLFNFKF